MRKTKKSLGEKIVKDIKRNQLEYDFAELPETVRPSETKVSIAGRIF